MSFPARSVTENIFGVVIVLVLVVLAYFKWSFTYWKRKGVRHPLPSIPFGNAFKLFKKKISFAEMFHDVYREYKNMGLKFCGLYIFSKPAIVFIDLDLIRTIMTKDFQHFTDHGNYINEEKDPLTGHLFSLKGLRWKNLRAKLTSTFSSGKIKMMFHTLVDCTPGLLEVVDEAAQGKAALDIKDVTGRYATDVIGSCAFGLNCNSLKNPDSEFRRYGKKIFQTGKKQAVVKFLSATFPKIMDRFSFTVMDEDVTNFFINVVKQTVEYREGNNVERNDFMHLLIELKNSVDLKVGERSKKFDNCLSAEETLTINEIAAQVFGFFVAGFETSSTTLTFCCYELATNANIQAKLRKEINDVLNEHNDVLTYDAMMDMKYMDKCIQEALRKYPPVPVLIRECTKEYPIPDSNVVLDKETQVFISVTAIHRDPDNYPDPESFDPERFSPENKAKRHPFSWLPFGEGPRACIGLRFGMMQTKIALAVLLRNYKFTLNSKTRTPLKFNFTNGILGVDGNIWLNVEKVAT